MRALTLYKIHNRQIKDPHAVDMSGGYAYAFIVADVPTAAHSSHPCRTA